MQNNKVSQIKKMSSAELFKELKILKNREEGLDREELKLLRSEIKKIRDILIERHLYIAEILAKKYLNRGVEYDDLYQVASLGLILALDRFNIDKGYEFPSYATPTIIGEIKRYFRDKGWVIRVPRRIQELSKRINSAKIELSQSLQNSPGIDQIADYLEVSSEEVIEAMEASQVYLPQSLDRSIDNSSDDKEVNIGDLLGIEDKSYENLEIMDFVKDIMSQLNDIERKIVVYRYFERMTQISIAEKLQMSQMTISRMEKKIIKKFRKEFEKI